MNHIKYWIEKKVKELSNIADKSLYPRLKSVSVEINSDCNRKCRPCPNHNYARQKAYLEEAVFYKVIHELKGIRFKGKLTFNLFNEPLLDDRLLKFIKFAKDNLSSVFIYLNTNGDFLTLKLYRDLRKAGLNFINITQYDAKINSNIRIIRKALKLNERISFYVRLFNEQAANNRTGLVKLDNNSLINQQVNKFCPRPFYQLCINYRGKAVLCCCDYFGSVEVGDLNTGGIADIWRSKTLLHYRKNLLRGNRGALKLCSGCNMR